MKSRIRKTLNFFAFNVLFFAIYLNFIQKDKSFEPTLVQDGTVVNSSSPASVSAVQPVEKKTEVKGAIN